MGFRLLLSPFVALMPVLVLGGTPASAQAGTCPPGGTPAYPPAACELAVSTTQVRPGEPVAVSGGGFAPNSTVTLRFDSTQVGTAQTNATGVLSTTVTVPANAAPGPHTITAVGTDPSGRPRQLNATVSVLGVQVTRDGTLPRTGSSSTVPGGIAGIVLVGVGSAAIVAARRRRTA